MKTPPLLPDSQTIGLILAAIASLMVQWPARGQGVIYSQPSNYPGGRAFASYFATSGGTGDVPPVEFDNFILTNAATIEAVTWRGGYFFPPNRVEILRFTVTFYDSTAAGEPSRDHFLNQTIMAGNAGETFVGNNGTYDLYDYGLTLSAPFTASANTRYWLSVKADTLGAFPEWGWATGTGGDNLNYNVALEALHRLIGDLAFTLQTAASPKLTMVATTTNTAIVSWPASSTGYQLQQNSALDATNWVDVSSAVNTVNGQNQVAVSTVVGASFYRLRHP